INNRAGIQTTRELHGHRRVIPGQVLRDVVAFESLIQQLPQHRVCVNSISSHWENRFDDMNARLLARLLTYVWFSSFERSLFKKEHSAIPCEAAHQMLRTL